MDAPSAVRIAGEQQRGLEERAVYDPLPAHGEPILPAAPATDDQFSLGGQPGNLRGDRILLRPRGERPHPDAVDGRVADDGRGKGLAQPIGDDIEVAPRHQYAPDRRALLPGLHRGFEDHFVDEQPELGMVGLDIGGQDRAVQRVGLGRERHPSRDQIGMRPQLGRRRRRTGQRDHVLSAKAVEQVCGIADHQLQRAFGQDA